MNRERVIHTAVMAALITFSATGCFGEHNAQGDDVNRSIEKEAMTDPGPVQARTTGLPPDGEYLWYSGTMGSDAPGPTTYWVDARVVLPDPTGSSFAGLCDDDAEAKPDVVAPLAAELPEGPYRSCDALDSAVAPPEWNPQVWISEDASTLVIRLVGEG